MDKEISHALRLICAYPETLSSSDRQRLFQSLLSIEQMGLVASLPLAAKHQLATISQQCLWDHKLAAAFSIGDDLIEADYSGRSELLPPPRRGKLIRTQVRWHPNNTHSEEGKAWFYIACVGPGWDDSHASTMNHHWDLDDEITGERRLCGTESAFRAYWYRLKDFEGP